MTTASRSLLLLALSSLPMACRGQPDDPARTDVFTERVVEAIRSKSAERRKALVHPKSLACWTTPQTAPFFDEMISRQLGYTIPASYSSEVALTPPDGPLAFEKQLDYPLRPTRLVQLHFASQPDIGMNMVFSVVRDGAHWYEVLPCPSADTIARMQAKKAEVARQEQRAQSLAAHLAGPLRAELVRLTREGRRVEAIQRYASSSRVDLAVVRRVVELVAPEER